VPLCSSHAPYALGAITVPQSLAGEREPVARRQ
jgi:hypothetical protein